MINRGMLNRNWLICGGFCLLFTVGCASSIQEPRYYLLTDPFADVSAIDSAAAETPILEVESCRLNLSRVTLAPYLQKNNIVLQTDGNQLVPAVYHRWSEPLEAGVARLLQSCLNPSQLAVGAGEVDVQVHLQHFHGDTKGRVVLEAGWVAGASQGSYRGVEQQVGDGYNALVTSHRNLLLEMCLSVRQRIASCS